jgi:hypothetical protein
MSGRATALRVLLGVAHVLMGVLLLLPMALLAGVSSPRALAKLPPLPALVLLPSVAFPVWVLVMGVRSFWRLTPGVVRALRWTHIITVAGSFLLVLSGVLAL